ncbi:MAG TPA: MDR family MFS transporter [Reyranella sp.]|nr:MDR family MFS transporter [Reyranella sp.]
MSPVAQSTLPSRRGLTLAACMMATFMAAVENTIVSTAMPTIVAELGDFHLFSWVFAVYLLTQAVSIPIYGRLSDLYGRRRVFFGGASLFLLGSTLCGFAHGMVPLIVFRALQGMGAGAVQPVAYAIVGDIYTPEERAKVQGLLSGMFGVAAIVGPTLGAVLVQQVSWSAVFWINLPIGAIAMAMLAAFFDEQLHPRPPRIDYLASLLLTVGAGALMLAMIQGRSLERWQLIACVAVGVAALAVLIRHERDAEAPMLPIRLWGNRLIKLCNLGSFAIGATMMAVAVFLPTYLQGVMNCSTTVTGIAFGAMAVSWAVSSSASGRMMIRTSYRASAMFGGAMLAAGGTLLAFMTPQSGPIWAAAGAALTGIGMGFCNTTFLVSVQAAAEPRERGTATASNMFTRMVGQASGAALFGAMVNAGLSHYAPGAAEVAEHLMEPSLRRTLSPDEIDRFTAAVAASVHTVYIVAAVLGLAVLLIGTRWPPRLRPGGHA